jgi:hypothetical protein
MSYSSKSEIVIQWSPFFDDVFILVDSSVLFYRILSYDGSCEETNLTNFLGFKFFFDNFRTDLAKNRNDTNIYLSDNSYANLFGSIDSFTKPKVHKIIFYLTNFLVINAFNLH